MKKLTILKPYLAIIFGVLLFLVYSNFLRAGSDDLAIGIIGVIISSSIVGLGVTTLFVEEETSVVMSRMVAGIYPLFLGVLSIIGFVDLVKFGTKAGLNAWILALFGMLVALAAGILILCSVFLKNKLLSKVASLFSALFVLVLLLDIMFVNGFPNTLGNISVLSIVIDVLYVAILLGSFPELSEKVKNL